MKFKQYSFKELLSNIVDNRGKTCPTVDQGLPLIATNCINNNSLFPVFEKVRYVNLETYKNWFRGHPQPDDIIFVCKGSPGRVAWVKDPVGFCIAQDMVSIRADKTKVDPKYLFALLRSDNVQQKISNMHVGSLIPHFKKGDFGNLYLDISEDMEYQRMVGEIYFNFSMKIEQNNQINQTLESIAQAIFKSWFIDFEPVRAKIAAKQTWQDPELAAMCAISGKSEAELKQMAEDNFAELQATAALFPDELVETELGEVPKGWDKYLLSKMITLIGGGTPKRSEPNYWNGDIFWFSVKDVPNEGEVFVITTQEKISELGLNKSSTKLLPVGTTVITARGTVGKIALVGHEMAMNQSCYGVQGINGVKQFMTYYLIKNAVDVLKKNTHGAVFDTITQATFDTVTSIKPSIEMMDLFESKVEKIMGHIKNNLYENISLIALRDTLLSRLLLGDADVTLFKD